MSPSHLVSEPQAIPRIIDTHCHLDIDLFDGDLQRILKEAGENGVTDFVLPGFIHTRWEKMLKLCRTHQHLHGAPGLHPLYLDDHADQALEELETICLTENIVAIGEIGLDLLKGSESLPLQKYFFEQQLQLATKYDLPVLLHVRKAHDNVLSILRKAKHLPGGIVHAFNGSHQQAEVYLKLGFKLGYGGNLTYDRATRIRELAATLPLSAIVLETDAPDIPLSHRRDTPNSPEFLGEVLEALSNLRQETTMEIACQTTKNVLQILPKISSKNSNSTSEHP